MWPYSANLECRSEMCCARLARNAGRKKNRQKFAMGTIVQLCRAISSQVRHILTIGKPVKQQYLPHMFPQYGELPSTNGWDLLASLGYPQQISTGFASWQRYCTASGSGRQPKFAALNRGRHLCSAGRPSRWALAHILVLCISLFGWSAPTVRLT